VPRQLTLGLPVVHEHRWPLRPEANARTTTLTLSDLRSYLSLVLIASREITSSFALDVPCSRRGLGSRLRRPQVGSITTCADLDARLAGPRVVHSLPTVRFSGELPSPRKSTADRLTSLKGVPSASFGVHGQRQPATTVVSSA